MSIQVPRPAALHALLIGVDYYLPNELPGGVFYSSLGGCVRDITSVEEFLREKLATPDVRIRKLTSSAAGGGAGPREQPRELATYENIVSAFGEVLDEAAPGDSVYIHYSGHGGRVPTLLPEVKSNGLDETLVPMDIGRPEVPYLRDIELAHVLRRMADKGLIVTVVLDSCHSGGATRGEGNVAVRGVTDVDRTPRPGMSRVAARAELAATWRAPSAGAGPYVGPGEGWLPEAARYVLLAACRPSEAAYEYAFDGREKRGVLTYWLLDSLTQLRPGLTYKQIYERILGKIHSQFGGQTPMLLGVGDRVVFGSDRVASPYSVLVMQTDASGQRVQLQAGHAQGVARGAQFTIYPPGPTGLDDAGGRLALAEVDDPGATISWAKVTARFRADAIETGARAVLLDPGQVRLRRNVRAVTCSGAGPELLALKQFEEALAEVGSGWVQLAKEGQEIDYQVAVNERGEYELWDPAGQQLVNMRPAIKARTADDAARVARRLVHLSKYHSVQRLDNPDRTSPLAHKLLVELCRLPDGFQPEDERLDPQPFDAEGGPLTSPTGEWLCLRIKNESSQVLNVAVFDLQPDWGISQIFPSTEGNFFEPLDGGDKLQIPLKTYLPPHYAEGTDVIKVFATVGAANFRWLELPPLDSPLTRAWKYSTKPADGLERLLAALASDHLKDRHVNPAAYPNREWTTASVALRVRRNAP